MSKRMERWDEADIVFFARELEHKMAQSRDVVYADLKWRQFLPVNREGGPAAEVITYEENDFVGEAKFIADKGRDLPRVDVKGKEYSHFVKSLGDAFGFSLQEVRAARLANKPLESRKLDAARRAAEVLMDYTTCFGNSDLGFQGFFNHSSVTVIDAAATGTGSSRNFADKTPDNIIADFRTAITTMQTATNGKEGNRVRFVLPDAQYTDLATRRLTDTGQTLISFLESALPQIESIVPWYRAVGQGATGDRMVCYTPDPMKLDVRVPQEFETFPPQAKGLEQEVPCHARYGGFVLYYPKSMLYVDQI